MERNNNPLISVIVPVYNVENYLEECVLSITGQTYRNIEIILIDDGSKDASGAICDKLQKKDDRIIVVHKENEGLGLTRNAGLSLCKGEYVTFVDSDDWMDLSLIEQLFDAMQKSGTEFSKCGFYKSNDKRQILFQRKYEQEIFEGDKARTKLAPRILGSLPESHDSIEMSVWGCLYKMSIIRDNRIQFYSERKVISEDMPFNFAYLQHANGGVVLSYTGYYYRYNQQSLTTSYRKDRFKATKHFFCIMHEALTEKGYDEEAHTRLNKMFFVYLRMCIAQEKTKASACTMKQARKNIADICSDSYVISTMNQYPIDKLGRKQKIFLKLIKRRCIWILFLLAQMKIL